MDEDFEVTTISVGWIWKLKTLSRIKTFLWMCIHDSIGVKECLVRRNCAPSVKGSLNQFYML